MCSYNNASMKSSFHGSKTFNARFKWIQLIFQKGGDICKMIHYGCDSAIIVEDCINSLSSLIIISHFTHSNSYPLCNSSDSTQLNQPLTLLTKPQSATVTHAKVRRVHCWPTQVILVRRAILRGSPINCNLSFKRWFGTDSQQKIHSKKWGPVGRPPRTQKWYSISIPKPNTPQCPLNPARLSPIYSQQSAL